MIFKLHFPGLHITPLFLVMSHFLLFLGGSNPNVLTQAKLPLISMKEAGSHRHLYYSEAAVMPPAWCHHTGKRCVVFLLVKTTVLSLWQYWRGEKYEKICQYDFKTYSNTNF